MVTTSRLEEKRLIRMSDEVLDALFALRDFLYETRLRAHRDARRVREGAADPRGAVGLLPRARRRVPRQALAEGDPESDGLSRAIADFFSGMTDRYAMRLYQEKLLPKRWTVL